MLVTFYLMKRAQFYNKIVLMTLKVCAEISEKDSWATKIAFFGSNNEYTWFSKYFVKYTGIPTFALKIKDNTSFYMYSVQVAQSRHQIIEYLTWKNSHNRRLFTIFRKLRSWREKGTFKWNCRINGGHICWKEAIQYRYIDSDIWVFCSVTINL